MTTWNYRVVCRNYVAEKHHLQEWGVHEVYYDSFGNVLDISEEIIAPNGTDKEELEQDLKRFTEALHKPVLDYDTLKEIKA